MTGSTGLHANQARFKLHEKREEFIAGEFLLKNSLTVAADTMKLETFFARSIPRVDTFMWTLLLLSFNTHI
uniref:Uncharacterized protein n=2 Tax=Yersinia enterocolitica W22703 TaxID=913028 RepID=F4N535_YEREN|nr:unknown protein [Yersinia enterocolitica W22703]